MRILLVGGTGFIGPPLARQLAAGGHRLAVFHRGQGCREAHIHGDRRQLAAFRDEFLRFAPDVVIDLILASEGPARLLMDTFRGIAGRIVVLSSVDVYRACSLLHRLEPGPPDPVPLTEDSPLRGVPPYPPAAVEKLRRIFSWIDDYDKVPAERVVMSDAGLPATVLRLPMIYGSGDYLHRLFPLLKRVDDGRPAILLEQSVAAWRGPRGYVEDVAQAIALAATEERARGRVYNVARPENFSELEWTELVARAAGFQGRVLALPAELAPPHLHAPYNTAQQWTTDSSRIRRELGYREAVPLEEGLRRTIAWERANPPAEIDPKQFDYAAEDAARAQLKTDTAF